MKIRQAVVTVVLASTVALGQGYQYYYSDTFSASIDTQKWHPNGSPSSGAGLYGTGSVISLISPPVPAPANDYEVKITLNLTSSVAANASYQAFLRAQTFNEAMGSGNAYVTEVTNISFSTGQGSINIWKMVNGAFSPLAATTAPCHNGTVIRSVMTATNAILVYVDNVLYASTADSTFTSGHAGVGVSNVTSANSIARVDLGPIDQVAPATIDIQTVGSAEFPNHVDLQWQGVTDDANGIGLAYYQILRDGSYLAVQYPNETEFSDGTVVAGHNYSYQIQAVDYHWNVSTVTLAVTTPPVNAIDPRQIGVRPTGSYWGGAGENIDMRSGNLNFTIPLLKAQGRGGWGVAINLSYNSEKWRQDVATNSPNWNLGRDLGYGYGWRLLAGSITPYYSGYWAINHYTFTDATGAEYRLDQNNGGVWSSLDAAYVWYDANTKILHFPDGSFWTMACTSAGTEQDSGVLYPTVMEDTNGNEILLRYNPGMSLGGNNSSSRLQQIEDVRAVPIGSPPVYYTYGFTYDQSGGSLIPPHLTGISNNVGTSENYTFTYVTGALQSPFSGHSFGTWKFLQKATNGLQLSNQFVYDTTTNSGELVQVTMPYGGYLKWAYGNANYTAASQREVVQRNLSKTGGESVYTITRAAPAYVHGSATLVDNDGNAKKTWTFQTDTTQFNGGLVTAYQQYDLPSGTLRSEDDYTWSQTSPGNHPYILQVVTTRDGVSKKTTQVVDQYGNLSQIQVYDWGKSTVARTYTNTYLTGGITGFPTYASLYIFNRLVSSTVTDGTKSTTLVQNTYDPGYISDLTGVREHDANMGTTWQPRGNVGQSITPDATTSFSRDIGGNIISTTRNGVTTTVATSSATNFAVPSTITTGTTSESLSWNAFLGITSAAGQNGDTTSIGYDANTGRQISTTSPFGAVTSYSYADTASPPTRTTTINSRWTKTTLDGFGRTIQTDSGDTQTRSTVQVQYAACGCSPLGKMSKVSEPYAPNAPINWTSYTYDGMGRTTKVTLPDGSATTYVYHGNSVTVTDAANKSKTLTMDAFGNLTQVDETDPTLGAVSTYYTYDILNHLIQVRMPRGATTQYRTFDYTGGSNTVGTLLRSATNPETNNLPVTYTYTNNRLATKTDANGKQFVYTYDTSGRLTQITANGNVVRTYYYDTNPFDSTQTFTQYTTGRLTAIQNATYNVVNSSGFTTPYYFTEMFGYQQAPAITTKRLRLTESVTYATGGNPPYNQATVYGDLDAAYVYDNEGRMTSITYPTTQTGAGAYYAYQYNSMGQASGMTDQNLNQIVSGVAYGPANELDAITYLGGSETRQYNSLWQLTTLTQAGLTNTYTYPTGTNNGKIQSQTFPGGEIVQYTYDSLNRLATATGSAWGQTFTYDGFGNLTNRTPSGSAPSSPATPADPATNRLTGYTYDNNGNLLTVGYGYDVENRLISAVSGAVQYGYDSRNKRVWMGNFDVNGYLTSEQVYFYGVDGSKLGTYNPTVTGGRIPQSIVFNQNYAPTTNVYFGGRLIQQGGTRFVADRLGSNGKYFPYGEERNSPQLQNDQVKFATYTRDNPTGLDYADQRYYSSTFGRFITPDPYVASATSPSRPSSPQSWNRYAYVRGDPTNRFDPTGNRLVCYGPPDDQDCDDDSDPEFGEGGRSSSGGGCLAETKTDDGCGAGGGGGDPSPSPLPIVIAVLTSSAHEFAKDLLSENIPTDCAGDLAKLGVTPEQWAGALNSVSVFNGIGSTVSLASTLPNGSVEQQTARSRNLTVGNQFYSAGTVAWASVNGPQVWINPYMINPGDVKGASALIAHETLHNLGLTDSMIQSALDIAITPITKNISDKLQTDCFPGLSGPGLLP